MDSVVKYSYHKRLFILLLSFLWVVILSFIGFQYIREKQYKSELLNTQLQMYNRQIIDVINDGNLD